MRAKYLGDDGRRQPEEISTLLGDIIERNRVDVDVRHGDLVSDWASFAPGDWARATPIGVRDHTLLVTVSDGSMASLLQFQHRELLEAIERVHGADLVTSVRVRIDRAR